MNSKKVKVLHCSMLRTVLIAVLAGVASLAASAQAQDSEIARLPNGKPNFSGFWQALNSAHYDLEPHVARPGLAVREGPHVPVPDIPVLQLGAVASVPAGLGVVEGGRIPYKPEALKQKQENQQNWIERDPEIKCYLPGIPRATYMPFPFQILHSERALFFAYEYAAAGRNVFLEDPGPAPADAWMGQSVASWDGDTLVITGTGFNDRTWFDRSGNFHSASLKVVERYTPAGPNHIEYSATIEDPETFTQPWTIRMPLYRRMEENFQLLDFKCVEFVEELMYGELRKNPLPRR